MDITFLGHSAYLLTQGEHRVLIDPFLSGNEKAPKATGLRADDIQPTHIALTHGHDDHIGDTVAIAKRTGATVYGAFELCEYLGEKGLTKLESGNPGGQIKTDFGFIAFTQAFHSSSTGGRYMGQPTGLIVRMGDTTVYHAGDTALFSDMALIGEVYRPDVAILPIGDRYTMGPELAGRAAEMIKPAKFAIPCHFNTWPPIAVDAARFAPKGVEVKVLEPGEKASA